MLDCPHNIATVEELRTYVNHTICQHEQLEPGAFHLSQRVLVRLGKPCGMYFSLQGPRAVQLSAIFETDRNTVIFYDCTGERFLQARLPASIPLVSPEELAPSTT